MATGASSSERAGDGGPGALRFGVFEMDLRSGELRRHGALVRLQPQPFRVLALLITRAGEVVTREEIQAEVWPAGTFVDFEQSLNFCIRQIRGALGDSALAPRFIETLPKRGYRWIGGAVESLPSAATLLPWRGEGEEPTPVPIGERATRWPVVVSLAAALAGLALAAWLALARAPVPEPPSFQRLTFRRGSVPSARFAPDGDVVYGASWDGQPAAVHVTHLAGRDTRALGIEAAKVVGVSTGGEVAFIRRGTLARGPLSGEPSKDVLEKVVAADWTADGSQFAVVRSVEGAYRLEYPIGRLLGTPPRVSCLRLSPDGRRLAFLEHPTPGDDRGSVVVVDESGRRSLLSGGWSSLEGIAWSPRGSEVWFTGARVGADSALYAVDLQGHQRRILAGMGRLVLHDIDRDGRVLLQRATVQGEILYRRAGGSVHRDLSWLDYSTVSQVSPDGRRLLFVESGEGGGADYTSFLRGTDGSPPVRLGPGLATSLSPDERWVLVIPVQQPDHVDVMPVGAGEGRRLQIAGAVAHEAAGFLFDGRTVFVTTRDAEGAPRTWLVDLEGGEPRPLPLPPGRGLYHNTFAPDGRRFIASCPTSERPCLHAVEGGEPREIAGLGDESRAAGWDSKGRLYIVERGMRLPARLRRVDPVSGRSEIVDDGLAPHDRAGVSGIYKVSVAADGESWAFSYIRRLSDLFVVEDLR
jgi:DNA-binding winged helix-turn-helix (wHTH) protein/Tol biopolymer transport system component